MSTAVTSQPLPSSTAPSIATTFGAALIGSYISASLYGLTTSQSYFYFISRPKDATGTRTLVQFLWALNTIHAIVVCHSVYYHLVTVDTDPSALWNNVWSLNASVLLHAIVACTTMLYYMKIIFQLCGKRLRWWLTGFIAIPIILHLAFGLDVCVRMFLSSNVGDLEGFTHSSILPFFILQVISDGLIAMALCTLLHIKRTGFKRSGHILNGLIIYAASRGLVTFLITLVMIIALVMRPGEMWYSGAEFAIVGLYTNSLLTMLNTRHSLSETGAKSPADDVNRDARFGLPGGKDPSSVYIRGRATNIEVIALDTKSTNHSENNELHLEEVKQIV